MENYPFIREWGQMMGLRPSYIKALQRLAAKEGAPHDAVYQSKGKWVRVCEMESLYGKVMLSKMVEG